jgi:hypothetical protein
METATTSSTMKFLFEYSAKMMIVSTQMSPT